MTQAIDEKHIEVQGLAAEIGRELSVLAGDMEHLQTLLSDILCGFAPDPSLVVQAQALDHAFQSLSQLSGVLARLAAQAEPHWRLERHSLLEPVSLSSLAVRLSGRSAPDHPADDLELL
jgi:hypothetical protein